MDHRYRPRPSLASSTTIAPSAHRSKWPARECRQLQRRYRFLLASSPRLSESASSTSLPHHRLVTSRPAVPPSPDIDCAFRIASQCEQCRCFVGCSVLSAANALAMLGINQNVYQVQSCAASGQHHVPIFEQHQRCCLFTSRPSAGRSAGAEPDPSAAGTTSAAAEASCETRGTGGSRRSGSATRAGSSGSRHIAGGHRSVCDRHRRSQ
jgi:hypothetical protein